MASSAVQDQLEIRFRLSNGCDIGPKSFPVATTITNLKESILAQWPKDLEGPRTVKEVKLISAGKILENYRTVGDCQSPLYDVPGGVTTMHVIVQPLSEKEKKVMTKCNRTNVDASYNSVAVSRAKLITQVWLHYAY